MTELLLAFINVCFLSKNQQKSLLYLCIIKCCVFFLIWIHVPCSKICVTMARLVTATVIRKNTISSHVHCLQVIYFMKKKTNKFLAL